MYSKWNSIYMYMDSHMVELDCSIQSHQYYTDNNQEIIKGSVTYSSCKTNMHPGLSTNSPMIKLSVHL